MVQLDRVAKMKIVDVQYRKNSKFLHREVGTSRRKTEFTIFDSEGNKTKKCWILKGPLDSEGTKLKINH